MSLTASTQQYVTQLGHILTYVDTSEGPAGPQHTVAYKLVPVSGYHNGERFPHRVQEELNAAGFKRTTVEGIEYRLVPEQSTNLPGLLSHYAQKTGVAELQNPPGGGVNRVLEVVDPANTVAPDAVAKYVKSTDNWEEARKREDESDLRVRRAIKHQ